MTIEKFGSDIWFMYFIYLLMIFIIFFIIRDPIPEDYEDPNELIALNWELNALRWRVIKLQGDLINGEINFWKRQKNKKGAKNYKIEFNLGENYGRDF